MLTRNTSSCCYTMGPSADAGGPHLRSCRVRGVGGGGMDMSAREVDERTTAAAARVPTSAPVALLLAASPEYVVAMAACWRAGGCAVPCDPALPDGRLSRMLALAAPGLLVAGPGLLERGKALLQQAGLQNVQVVDASAFTEPGGSNSGGAARPARADGGDKASVCCSPAVIVFTSGTSGQPKGVVVPHRALAQIVRDQVARYAVSASDGCALMTSCSYAFSLKPLLVALATGATLLLPAPGRQLDPAHMAQLLGDDATLLYSVPTMLAVLLRSPGFAGALRASRLRLAVLAGERAGAELLARLDEALPPTAVLVQLYGCSEAQAIQCVATARGGQPGAEGGAPAAVASGLTCGTQAFLLTAAGAPGCGGEQQQLQPLASLPAGSEGELVVGGPGVALPPYLVPPSTDGAASAASDVFLPHPSLPGRHLYRTGDLVCVRPGGLLEILGRRDRQVKINGVRVELTEVEAALTSVPGVTAAVALVLEGGGATGGNSSSALAAGRLVGGRLVAAVCPASINVAAVMGQCAASLPAAMGPSRVVAMEALPLLASGKIDVAAVGRAVEAAASEAATAAAMAASCAGSAALPRTSLEAELLDIWARHLPGAAGGGQVAAADAEAGSSDQGASSLGFSCEADVFLDWGASSLDTYAMTSVVQEALGPHPAVAASLLHRHRSVRAYAAALQANHQLLGRGQATAGGPLPACGGEPAPVEGDDGWRPLTPLLEGCWFHQCSRGVAPGCNTDMSVVNVLHLQGALDVGALHSSVALVAGRHEAFRLQLAAQPDGSARCRLLDQPRFSFDCAAGPARSDGQAVDLMAEAAARPFDLTGSAPLLRALVVEHLAASAGSPAGEPHPQATTHSLLLCMHHAVVDMLACRQLLRELRAAYVALARGSRPSLPPPSWQYSDYAGWAGAQLAAGGGRVRAELEAAWRQELEGVQLPVPCGLPMQAVPLPRPEEPVRLAVSAQVCAGLPALERALGVSRQAVLLGCYAALLSRWGGQERIPIWTPVAGRDLPQQQSLVAEVANCLPAVVAVGGGASLGEVVADAWARMLTLMDRALLPIRNRQDLGAPGGRVAADWQPGMHPLTQVFFQFHADGGAAEAQDALAGPLLGRDGSSSSSSKQQAHEGGAAGASSVAWSWHPLGAGLGEVLTLTQMVVFGGRGGGGLEVVLQGRTGVVGRKAHAALAAAYEALLAACVESGGGAAVADVPLPSLAEACCSLSPTPAPPPAESTRAAAAC